MDITVTVIEIVCMLVFFSFLTMGLLLINPLTFISDYPPEIQQEYYRSQHKETSKKKLTVIMKIKKITAVIVYIFLLAWMMHRAGCRRFLEGVMYSCALIFILFVWDTFVLDWLLFPNIKRVRLPGTEHMDREYHQKWFHVKVCLPMIPVSVAMAVLSSLVMEWIY